MGKKLAALAGRLASPVAPATGVMRRRATKQLLLAYLALGGPVACADSSGDACSQFTSSWNDAALNSAVSFWYMGSTDSAHRIEERWPTRSIDHVVSRSCISLVEIDSFADEPGREAINLKQPNIEFSSNAS